LVPCKEICHIYVQIIHLWKNYIAADRYIIELVLCDAFGDKIHASISIIQSGGAYRTSKHAYLIEFVRNTSVCVCDFLPRALTGFEPVAFRDIFDGLVNTKYLVDVIGQIVGVSHLEIVSFNEKDTEKITLELQNQLSDRLTVHLLGKYAIFVHDATQNVIQEKSIICVIRFGKIGLFKDSVSTAYGFTDVSLNPGMVEVERLADSIGGSKPYCPIPELYGKFRFFKPIIQKSIIEVKEMLYLTLFTDSTITLCLLDIQRERYIVMCTIAAIDYDMGWYYLSCKICWKRVLLVPSDHMVYGIQKSQIKKKYYCANCNNYRPQLLPRYNLQLAVLDNTGHAKFLLLDNLAEELFGISCGVLYGSSADQIEDPVVVHSVLSKLIGGTYFCKIVIEEQNFLFNCQTFKVLEIIPTYEF
ncbi:hypothetical protein HID58_018438, partial [Brassica napus]